MMNRDDRFSEERWQELADQWEKGDITVEQLNGQMFVWLGYLCKTMATYERAQDDICHTLADQEARLQGVQEQLS